MTVETLGPQPQLPEVPGICADCGGDLPAYDGRGRPRLRCEPCQAEHRRQYLRDAKRRQRARPE